MPVFSKLGTLVLNDWWKGFIIAIITVPVDIIYQVLKAFIGGAPLTFDWKQILAAMAVGACTYLLKNLGTGSQGRMLTNK